MFYILESTYDDIEPFVTGKESWDDFGVYYGEFDKRKYIFNFFDRLQVLRDMSVTLPYGLTMSTSFTGYEVCKNEDNTAHKWVRCRLIVNSSTWK